MKGKERSSLRRNAIPLAIYLLIHNPWWLSRVYRVYP